ncbi:Hypp4607 [Branchiostoma lanceolatum]|uniref:L-ectoine synthase n=1 Tax=Branchiostoma lanceolatum TaxID=7740 RepID=A0A8K0AEI8_BRALA|nr:Hypp4607 [Branchiostoma lanceolatum]
MIVRHSVDLPIATVPLNPVLRGKELVSPSDGMGFTAYEIVLTRGQQSDSELRSGGEGWTSNHMYYCISGSGICNLVDGREFEVAPDVFMAFSSAVSVKITVTSEDRMRLFCVYCNDDSPSCDRVVVRSLSEIIGTDRDVDWGGGNSRRFLLRDDKFPITVNNTSVRADAEKRFPMWYKHHKEAAYFIKGNMKYVWEEGEEEAEFHPDGTTFVMNKNDPHHVVPKEESIAVCAFFPSLIGNEKHVFSGGYSVYGAA